MIQSIFFLSDSGEVMLEKQMTGRRVDRSICAWFWDYVLSQGGDPSKVLPVIASPTHYLFQIFRGGIIFLACTQVEMPPLMGIEFLGRVEDVLTDYLGYIRLEGNASGFRSQSNLLYTIMVSVWLILLTVFVYFWTYLLLFQFLGRVADVLTDYLGALNEDLVKDNFVIVYELLDEMMDNGFPLTTEPNILRDMISAPNVVSKMLSVVTGKSSNVSSKLPDATSSCVPWRTTNLTRSSNEIYVTLVEEMDAVFNSEGALVKCEIYGEVQVNSHLPGLPDLTLSFANRAILYDVKFHPCVRFRPWESNQVLSFVPPDGEFKLMSYRIKKLKKTPIYVKPQLSSNAGNCSVNVLVGMRDDPGKTIDSITVKFQLPPCVSSADLTSNHGTVNILADKTCYWVIGQIPKDKAPSLSGNLVLESGLDRLHFFPVFQINFKIMGVALSGLQIDKLDVKNTPNPPYKGFRAVTQAGEYEVRA